MPSSGSKRIGPWRYRCLLDVASNSSDRAGVARQCFKAASQSNTSPLKCHPARWRRETGDGLPPCHGLFSHCPSPSFFSFLPGFSAPCLAPSRNLGPNVMNLIWTGLSPFPSRHAQMHVLFTASAPESHTEVSMLPCAARCQVRRLTFLSQPERTSLEYPQPSQTANPCPVL